MRENGGKTRVNYRAYHLLVQIIKVAY